VGESEGRSPSVKIEELAGMFEMEKNNVTVRLHRIRLRLQAEMER
jgi:DNA-directed RNA polymerase specialized sigma24 family protein